MLVVEGEPGVGKTALWRAALDCAEGTVLASSSCAPIPGRGPSRARSPAAC